MDDQQPQSEKSKTNLYVVLFAVFVVILFGIGYFHFFGPRAVPDTFFTVYQYQDTAAKKLLPAMVYDYSGISKAINAKDNAGAAEAAKKMLVQALKNQAASEDIQKKSTEMKLLLSQVTDSAIREKISNLFGQIDDRNKRISGVVTAQTGVFTVLRDHFGAAAAGMKGPDIPQNIDAVIQSSQREIQAISQLQTTIDFSYEEIVKLAGVDTTVSQTADSIRMSLSATPEVDPSITDYPTPTPTPSLAPTAVPTASPSASPEASSSAQ